MPELTCNPLTAGDVAAVTSFTADAPERLRNLELWVRYLTEIAPDIELVVIEQDTRSRIDGELNTVAATLHHLVPTTGSHWKTRNQNLGAKLSSRPLLLFLDCDVLLPPAAIAIALDEVRENGGFVQPFNGVMAEIHAVPAAGADLVAMVTALPHFERDYDRDLGAADFSAAAPIYGGSDYHATGGAMACRRGDFFRTGGYNENFVSYGFEDMEFFARVPRLGFKLNSIDGYNAYHLPHPREDDSLYSTHYRANEAEYQRVCTMKDGDLVRYALNGFREMVFRHGYIPQISQGQDHFHVDLVRDERLDLRGQEFVFVATEVGAEQGRPLLERLLGFLEQHCRGYLVRVFEIGTHRLRHPANCAHYIHTWLDPVRFDVAEAKEYASAQSAPSLDHIEFIGAACGSAGFIRNLRISLGALGATSLGERLQREFVD